MNLEIQARYKVQSAKEKKAEYSSRIESTQLLLRIAKVLTFLMLLGFALSLYVGDIWYIESFIRDMKGGFVGLIFFTVVAFLLAYVLSGSKHAIYMHLSLYEVSKIILVVVVVVGLMGEAFTGAGVQDMKARSISENSAEHKTLISQTSTNVDLNPDLTDKISKASVKLAQCRVAVSEGRDTHCTISSARLVELRQMKKDLTAAQIEVSKSSQTERYSRLDKIKEDSYNPILKSISETFSVDISQAISILMFFFSAMFEALHFYMSRILRELVELKTSADESLQRALVEYAHVTGSEFSPSGSNAKRAELAKKEDALFNYQKKSDQPAPDASTDQQDAAKTDQQPTQPVPQKTQPSASPMAQPTTAQSQLFAGSQATENNLVMGRIVEQFDDSEPTKDSEESDKTGFGFIPWGATSAANSTSTGSTMARLPQGQTQGGTGIANPVLGSNEKHYELPLNNVGSNGVSEGVLNDVSMSPNSVGDIARNVSTASTTSGQTTSGNELNNVANNVQNNVVPLAKTTSDTSAQTTSATTKKPASKVASNNTKKPKKESSSDVYAKWKEAVLNGDIKPTISASRPFIQKLVAGDQSQRKTPTLKDIGVIANSFFKRACLDKSCPMIEREDWKFGQRDKYIITK